MSGARNECVGRWLHGVAFLYASVNHCGAACWFNVRWNLDLFYNRTTEFHSGTGRQGEEGCDLHVHIVNYIELTYYCERIH